jgi:predicted nucleotidyltransferase
MQSPTHLHGIAEMHGGLAERVCRAAREATDLSTFYTLAATKKYTDSRVRRAILYGMTGVTEEDLKATPAYVNLLGATDVGRAFLSAYRKKKDADLPVITRPAAILDSEANAAFRRQAELQLRAEALYTLAFPMPQAAGRFLKERAVLV